MKLTDKIEFLNCDCIEYMRTLPDNAFDLAVVDPPYGAGLKMTTMFKKYAKRVKGRPIWDTKPDEEYFKELFRVSRNQIIFGGNYFSLPPTRGFMIWRKTTVPDTFKMAQAEYIWTSFYVNSKIFSCASQGTKRNPRIHPTQKPYKLYRWLLEQFAKESDKILDTHGGSCSIAIACHDLGLELTVCELDEDYFDMAVERFNKHLKDPLSL